MGLLLWRTRVTSFGVVAPKNRGRQKKQQTNITMAPVNFLEYGKSYGSRLYGKTPSKYLHIEFKLIFQFNIVLKHKSRFFCRDLGKVVQDISIVPNKKRTFLQNKQREAMSSCCLQLAPWQPRPDERHLCFFLSLS